MADQRVPVFSVFQDVIVGDDNCRIVNIAWMMANSPALIDNWAAFAIGLGISRGRIYQLQCRLDRHAYTITQLFIDLLELWKSMTTRNDRSLAKILEILRSSDFNLSGLAEEIQRNHNRRR